MDKAKGELMKVSGFGPLQGLHKLRPEDYKNYLKMISATNKAVKFPQFHAVISAEGKSYDKFALTEIAEQWLAAMGYGGQPYLIVYHHDTNNRHVHMVTTRVGKQGKKIRDSFENIRAIQQLNQILGIDEKHTAKVDTEKALTYQFATRAQFMMILESKAYVLKEVAGKFQVIKFGKQQGEVDLHLVEERLKNNQPDHNRKVQLKALFHKYAGLYATDLTKGRTGYTSEFSARLKQKFGIDLIFHASGDKLPYGYTIIDHAERSVFKGGEIMPLKELLAVPGFKGFVREENDLSADQNAFHNTLGNEFHDYYAAILKATLYNYPDLEQGLQHQGLVIIRKGEHFTIHDPGTGMSIDTDELLDEKDHQVMVEYFSQLGEVNEEVYRQYYHIPEVYIAPDVDDEAINGRNRRRKKKARTNTR